MSIDTNYVYINVNTNIENRHKRIEIYIIGTSILCFKKKSKLVMRCVAHLHQVGFFKLT